MKAVLCSVPGEPVHYVLPNNARSLGALPPLPKLAITSLVSWMEKCGYTQDQYDFYDIDMLLPSQEEIAQYFKEMRPNIVGLSAVTSGTYGQVKRLARTIREVCPEALIVLGGNLSASANVVLRKTEVDICVVGDGEVAWVKLLNYVEQHGRTIIPVALESISGLAFLNENSELLFTGYGERLNNTDLCLIPNFELLKRGLQDKPELFINYFRKAADSHWFNHDPRTFEENRKPNVVSLIMNKGCVARCTFCQRSTKGYRVGDLDALEKLIIDLADKHGVGFVTLDDENFGSDRKAAIAFAEIMKRQKILWIAGGVRCDSVTRELIQLYAESGCVGMKFGVESGSQSILDMMEKKFAREQVVKAVTWCREFKIFSPLAIMFGMPGETEETARETGKFLAEISAITETHPAERKDLFYAIPFPGTPLYEYGQQVGVIGNTVDKEEQYLEALFSAPSHKLSYVNLNGAPLGEVLFWDVLAQLEAMRYYYSAEQSEAKTTTPVAQINAKQNRGQIRQDRETFWEIVRRKIKTRKWKISVYPFASIFIQKKVIPSPRMVKLPRLILYPAIKLLLLLEYYAIRMSTKGSSFNYYQSIVPMKGVRRIDDKYRKGTSQKRRPSLRDIVITNRTRPESVTEENRIKLNAGL
jgi:radical SAM superfamily enzyme YgiQ (UPF0313 family)